MELKFFFKGENGQIQHTGPYSFEQETVTQLKKDFEDYCTDSNPIRGGCYQCTSDGRSLTVFLKFNEILYLG